MQSSRASDESGPRAADAPPADEQQPAAGEQSSAGAPAAGADQQGPSAEEHAAAVARLDDLYKRALADLDNYRKRAARDMERRVDEAVEGVLREWLEVVDSVERGLKTAGDSEAAAGLRAVLEQVEGVLARFGVQRVGVVGERFDPARHEAVEVRPSDESEDQTIVEVLRSGWARGDRLLRPAQVIVSRRTPAAEPSS